MKSNITWGCLPRNAMFNVQHDSAWSSIFLVIDELDTRYLFYLASKIMLESMSVHLESDFVSLLNLDDAEWKDLRNDKWPSLTRFKLSWE